MTRSGLQLLGGLAASFIYVFGSSSEFLLFAGVGALLLCVIIDVVMSIFDVAEDDTSIRGNMVLFAAILFAALSAIFGEIPKGEWAAGFHLGVFAAAGLIFATWFFHKTSGSATRKAS